MIRLIVKHSKLFGVEHFYACHDIEETVLVFTKHSLDHAKTLNPNTEVIARHNKQI